MLHPSLALKMHRPPRVLGEMDRLYEAAVAVERVGGLFVYAAVPGVDDGVRVEGSRVGRECSDRCTCIVVVVLPLVL